MRESTSVAFLVSRSAIGAGEITIRDPTHQNQAIAAINRDLTRAQKITKDESSGVEFYASDSAVREIASGFQVTRENLARLSLAGKSLEQAFGRIGQLLIDRGQLTPGQLENAKRVTQAMEASETDVRSLLTCSSTQGGFNLFNWFIPPARASGCVILSKDTNREIASLSPQERQACLAMLNLMAQDYLGAQLDGTDEVWVPTWVTKVAQQIRVIDAEYPTAREALTSFGLAGDRLRELAIYYVGGKAALETYRGLKKTVGAFGGLAEETAQTLLRRSRPSGACQRKSGLT